MRRIITIICLCMASLSIYAKSDILIYTGPGAGPKSIANTLATLRAVVADKYTIKTVGPEDIIDATWLETTALLVMPGGADRPYLEKLSGPGNANIRRFVEEGGKYLGICAGAYYSADRIEFAKGDVELEVIGERELKFFPGLVAGPTYAGFDHRDTSKSTGMRAAMIHWQDDDTFANNELVLFYNGGGHFVDAEKYPEVIILARYGEELPSRPNMPAAIVECKVGKGVAVLSGPHFEWFPESLEGPQYAQIKSQLSASNTARVQVAKHLLSRLDIATR